MIRLLADENFDNDIVSGILRPRLGIDIVRVQDVGLRGADDKTILEWAASERRVVLSHDAATLTGFAYARVTAGLSMPGVLEVRRRVPRGQAVDEIILFCLCSQEGEWEGQVIYLPLK